MSTEQDKIKHSKRLLKDDNAINKQLKIAKTFGADKYIKEPHRLEKQHALDCGNPQCIVCHSGKVQGAKSIKEQRFDQDLENTRNKRSNGVNPDEKNIL